MITVAEALQIIEHSTVDYGVESIPLSESVGRVLAEDWRTDRDLPPYNRAAMDGIAIQYKGFEQGQRSFQIEGVAAAGTEQLTLNKGDHCIEVMTGGVLPHHCDTVIRYEDLTIDTGTATINIDSIRYQQNVHHQGSDHPAGDLIVSKGALLSSAEIGVGATIGKSLVSVKALPKVIVISTGDELVSIDTTPATHQIRRSNVHKMLAVMKDHHIYADHEHLNDDQESIKERLSIILKEYDVVLMSGGVSKGKFDFLPKVLSLLGVEQKFHRICQKPGRPFWFGQTSDHTTVFAFPGNPISTYLCLYKYFLHWLRRSLQLSQIKSTYAVLTADISFKPDLTYFPQVSLQSDDHGRLIATHQKGGGSGDLANITRADAFIELTQGKEVYRAGEVYEVIMFR